MFSCFSYLVVIKPESQQGWICNTTKCLIVKKVFLSRVSFLINNHSKLFSKKKKNKKLFKKKKKKKKLHRDSLVLILSVWSEPAVSKITVQQSATWMAKTGWLFLFSCFSFYFCCFVSKRMIWFQWLIFTQWSFN